ncbi:hypothetical protein GALMADRAFT_147222 [Galerina marginata CBS 339.88]|uniref:Uncharacterized protein n=1 Tax=Galerina marginata (strain CBS 339.88) TaxID=685588 RepID=A0A067S9F4_GALM3|nr:hypothetical protein GALMADRAFT_147222 [Galerina marginata CBS 339.88]
MRANRTPPPDLPRFEDVDRLIVDIGARLKVEEQEHAVLLRLEAETGAGIEDRLVGRTGPRELIAFGSSRSLSLNARIADRNASRLKLQPRSRWFLPSTFGITMLGLFVEALIPVSFVHLHAFMSEPFLAVVLLRLLLQVLVHSWLRCSIYLAESMLFTWHIN